MLRLSCISLLQPARRGRCAKRTASYGDCAERLNPTIWFSSRDSYQRRGDSRVVADEAYGLSLPRTKGQLLNAPAIKHVRTCGILKHTNKYIRRDDPGGEAWAVLRDDVPPRWSKRGVLLSVKRVRCVICRPDCTRIEDGIVWAKPDLVRTES